MRASCMQDWPHITPKILTTHFLCLMPQTVPTQKGCSTTGDLFEDGAEGHKLVGVAGFVVCL